MRLLSAAPFFLLLFASSSSARTLGRPCRSPHFVIKSADPNTDRLPLKETRADVDISGVIARVRVTQIYENAGSNPLEAIYVFPGSTRAAVFGMKMTIGERTIVARISEKKAARRLYERAKRQGKSASLLEQKRPNVFSMNVANIMPADRIKVELDYTELLLPEDGTYEFVFPTVVGPRHDGAKSAKNWVQNPFLKSDQPPYRWDLTAKIEAGMGIKAIHSASHEVNARFTGPNSVLLDLDDERGGNRDFVLRYRLAGEAIETGLLTYQDAAERFFLLMMMPPQRPPPGILPPREYIFVIDVSGSMKGFPLRVTKDLIRSLLGDLRQEDQFNVLLFASSNKTFRSKSTSASPVNVKEALRFIDKQRGGGGTRLLPALKKVLAMPRSKEMSTSVVVVTDGYVKLEREAFDLIKKSLGDANLFAFGIGKSVNRHLIEGMARTGMGEPFVVLDKKEAKTKANQFRRYITSPVLTNIGVQIKGFDVYDMEPLTIPDLFASRPIIVFGKYRGEPTGSITVEGSNGQGYFERPIAVTSSPPNERNIGLKYLWARHRLQSLADVGKVRRHDASIQREITALGLKYELMTEYTSFIAVDSLRRNQQNQQNLAKVRQPTPKPKGVHRDRRGRRRGPPPPPHYSRRTKSMGVNRAKGGYGEVQLDVPVADEAEPLTASPDPAPPPPAAATPVDQERAGAADLDDSYAAEKSASKPASPPMGRSAPKKRRKSKSDRARSKIEVRNVAITGGIGRHQVIRTIRNQSSQLSYCLQSGTTRAQIGVRITLDRHGRVDRVVILRSSGAPKIDRCILNVLRLLRFDPPSSESAEIRMSLVLRS